MKITFQQALPALVVLAGGGILVVLLVTWRPDPVPAARSVASTRHDSVDDPAPAAPGSGRTEAGHEPARVPPALTATGDEEPGLPVDSRRSRTEPTVRPSETEPRATGGDSPPASAPPGTSKSHSTTTTPRTTHLEQPAAGVTPAERQETSAAESGPAAEPGSRPRPDDTERAEPPEEPEAAGPAVVRMVPGSSEYAVGERVSITIRVSSPTSIAHVPFHLEFDPAVLRFDLGEEGGFLAGDGAPTAFFANPRSDGASVVVGLSRLGQVGGLRGDGELCVLHFVAVGPGDARLAFARATVRDAANRPAEGIFEAAPVAVH